MLFCSVFVSSVLPAEVIVILSRRIPEREPLSAFTVNVEVPAAVGVPEIVPFALSVSP